MVILAALTALGSRFAGKVLTTALGWASTLLFGRVPAGRQILLVGITFGSIIWLVLLAGVVLPDIGTLLLVLVPPQELVPEWVIRAVMLAGALATPAIVGGLTLALAPATARQRGGAPAAIARGYPLTILLAVLLIFLAFLAIWRKGVSLARRHTDAHVPLIVEPGAYEQVAADLRRAVSAAGLDVEARAAPAAMSRPAQWLASIGGSNSSSLVPERMIQLRGQGLDILIYPMDLLISGRPELVARARAAMASRLTTSAAHLTVTAEAQALEDRLAGLGTGSGDTDSRPRFDAKAATAFAEIDAALATLVIPYEEWEVLYRQRLQVERDLRAHAMAGEAVVGAGSPGAEAPQPAPAGLLRLVRGGGALLDAAIDERTLEAIKLLAGPRVRPGLLTAIVAAKAARAAASRGFRRWQRSRHQVGGARSQGARPTDPAGDDRIT
jgi:hypothetical protein